ncbi:hypothetical protein [Embleya sp. NPDC059237]|uniref:hypothetical protein n=1 Tax=Embleya sp. NPDC059237 TaxID=3346784 RepID=UPI00369FEC7E
MDTPPSRARTLTGGPLDGEVITLPPDHGGDGVLLPQTEGDDDRLHSYEPGADPADGRLYYQWSLG